MRRHSAILAAIAIVGALAALPAAVASGAGPEEGTWVKVELQLQANNGLHAHLENSEDGTVTLELTREGQVVTYEVPGRATEAGLKVRFGRLGMIDVSFTPTKTLGSTEPGEGCTGAPRTLREGVFSGTIEFTGERQFVRIEGPQARGSMGVVSQWTCPEAEREAEEDPYGRAARAPKAKSRGARDERETASLYAYDLRCGCVFAAGVHHRHSGGKSIFIGYKMEKREGMQIFRATRANGPASAFDYDHAAGTAELRPPSPFRGSASFERRQGKRALWRSSIRVPLLGSEPIDTGGPGFAAQLHPEYQFD